jgi:hypothetical protein
MRILISFGDYCIQYSPVLANHWRLPEFHAFTFRDGYPDFYWALGRLRISANQIPF